MREGSSAEVPRDDEALGDEIEIDVIEGVAVPNIEDDFDARPLSESEALVLRRMLARDVFHKGGTNEEMAHQIVKDWKAHGIVGEDHELLMMANTELQRLHILSVNNMRMGGGTEEAITPAQRDSDGTEEESYKKAV